MKKRTCGECKWYNKSTEKEDPMLGTVHACDKGYICNSWNYTINCNDFEIDMKEKKND